MHELGYNEMPDYGLLKRALCCGEAPSTISSAAPLAVEESGCKEDTCSSSPGGWPPAKCPAKHDSDVERAMKRVRAKKE